MRNLKEIIILSTIVMAMGLMVLVISENTSEVGEVRVADIDDREIGLFQMTNGERENQLEWDDCLNEQARERAKFLYENKYWAHYTPDGTTPWQFVEKCGYHYAGENLIKGFSNPEEMNDALMKSELHRKNITNPRYNAMGTGCHGDICVEFFKD